MSTDEQLLAQWQQGDNDAGAALFRRLYPSCRRFFVNKVTATDVEDLLQKTFSALVERLDTFRGDASVRAFVFGIARRVLLRYLRDFARRDSKHDPDLHVSSIARLGVTPGTAIAIRDEQELVRQALQRIPVHQQTLLELSYWEEVSNAELAKVFEIEPTTVRTRLFRARKALAEQLADLMGNSEDEVERTARSLAAKI